MRVRKSGLSLGFLLLAMAISTCGIGASLPVDDLISPTVVITNATYSAYDFVIDFKTTNDPPYLVGVYPAEHAQFFPSIVSRSRPLAYRVTNSKHVRMSGDFKAISQKFNLFVQVLPVSYTNGEVMIMRGAHSNYVCTNVVEFRVMTAEEIAKYQSRVQSSSEDGVWARSSSIRRDAIWNHIGPVVPGCSQEVPMLRLAKPLSVTADHRTLVHDFMGRRVWVNESTNIVPNRVYMDGLE